MSAKCLQSCRCLPERLGRLMIHQDSSPCANGIWFVYYERRIRTCSVCICWVPLKKIRLCATAGCCGILIAKRRNQKAQRAHARKTRASALRDKRRSYYRGASMRMDCGKQQGPRAGVLKLCRQDRRQKGTTRRNAIAIRIRNSS
jgi:hypothetical protein